MSTIICLKLTTGEDLIARCLNDEAKQLLNEGVSPLSVLILEDVHVITLQQVAPNQIGMNLIPWLLGDRRAKVSIDAAHVIATYRPDRTIEEGFAAKTSPIQIAKSVPSTKMQLS